MFISKVIIWNNIVISSFENMFESFNWFRPDDHQVCMKNSGQ